MIWLTNGSAKILSKIKIKLKMDIALEYKDKRNAGFLGLSKEALSKMLLSSFIIYSARQV